MLTNNNRRIFTISYGSEENADIRAAVDPANANKINIHLGNFYISMSLGEFDEMVKAVYVAVNLDKAIKEAAQA